MKAIGRYLLLGFFLLMLGLLVGYRCYLKLTSKLLALPSYITELELLSIQTSYHTEEWPIKFVQ